MELFGLGKRSHLFSIKINPTDGATSFDWSFQWRYVFERDRRHKLTMTKRQKEQLECAENKKDLVVADFLYHYFTGYNQISGERESIKVESKYSLISADFDRLPIGFDSFDKFIDYLREKYKNAVILKTPSDKAKVLFLVEQDTPGDRSFGGPRWRALSSLLSDENLLAAADPRPVSNYKCFFTTEMLKSFNFQKDNLTVSGRVSSLSALCETTEHGDIKISDDIETVKNLGNDEFIKSSEVSSTVGQNRRSKFSSSALQTGLIKRLNHLNISCSKKFLKLIASIVKTPYSNNGIQISQKKLSNNLKMSIGLTSKYLKKAESEGLIETTDSSYVVGSKSRSYKLIDKVLLRLHGLYHSYRELPDAKNLVIEPGNWNATLFNLTRFFDSEIDFLNYVRKVPQLNDKPERIVQAINAWKNHKRRMSGRKDDTSTTALEKGKLAD